MEYECTYIFVGFPPAPNGVVGVIEGLPIQFFESIAAIGVKNFKVPIRCSGCFNSDSLSIEADVFDVRIGSGAGGICIGDIFVTIQNPVTICILCSISLLGSSA